MSATNEKVVSQAYEYAIFEGAQFVVVTNGDYYGVFDRERGLSVTENFVGDYPRPGRRRQSLRSPLSVKGRGFAQGSVKYLETIKQPFDTPTTS